MEIKVDITLTAPALTQALLALATSAAHNPPAAGLAVNPAPIPALAPPPVAVQAPPIPSAPMYSAPVAPVMQSVPFAPPTPPVPAPVPVTTAPAYTIDTLANAAALLMQAGKQQELVALLGQFGVQALTHLKPDQYGAFATALRQMGGKI